MLENYTQLIFDPEAEIDINLINLACINAIIVPYIVMFISMDGPQYIYDCFCKLLQFILNARNSIAQSVESSIELFHNLCNLNNILEKNMDNNHLNHIGSDPQYWNDYVAQELMPNYEEDNKKTPIVRECGNDEFFYKKRNICGDTNLDRRRTYVDDFEKKIKVYHLVKQK